MKIEKITVGELRTNTYIVSSSRGDAFVVDPGDEAALIVEYLERIPSVNLRYVLLTHGHFDHVLAVDDLTIKYPNASAVIHEEDVGLLRNVEKQGAYLGKRLRSPGAEVLIVSDGSRLPLGGETIEVIHTPGHTKGSVCYRLGDVLFSGDTIFFRSRGRIDLPWSVPEKMKDSVERILGLPPELRILPGHGEETTVGAEASTGNRL